MIIYLDQIIDLDQDQDWVVKTQEFELRQDYENLSFGLQVKFGLQLKEISDMKNKKIESGLAGLVFGLKKNSKR